jgi:hypothetical protein
MAIRKIKLRRGLESQLPVLDIGEPGFTTNTKKFFIGSETGNIEYPSLTAVQALIDNLDLSEIDLEGLATEEYVTNAISAIPAAVFGNFEVSGLTITGSDKVTITNESSDEDMRIRAGDDLHLEAHGDNIFIRSADDVIIQTNYNFSESIIDNEWEFASDGTTYLAKNSSSNDTYLSTPSNNTEVSLEITAGRDIYLRTAGYDNDGQGGSTSLAFKFDDEGAITFPDGTVQTTAFTGGEIPDIGEITFNNNNIIGNIIGQEGTIVSASTSSTGTTSSNSNALLLSSSIPNIDSVAIGWTVTFAGNITKTVVGITDISSEVKQIQFDGDAFVYNYPITMTSPDYVAGSDPEVNIIAGDKQWKFDNDGELTFPDGTVQTTAFNVIDAKDTYGCFHKLASLTAPAADTVYNFDWYTDTTVHESEGVTVTSSNPTRISIAKSGKYSVFTEMIVRINGSGERNVFLWLAKNGTDIPETGVKVSLRQGGVSNPVFETLSKQWFLDDINANDYIELRYALNRVDLIELEYTPAQTEPYIRPAIPSATISIIEV